MEALIKIPLDLSRHCIQTEISRLYSRMLALCLKSAEPGGDTEKKLELLKQALEKWDFPALRSNHIALAGGQDNTVALVEDDAGRAAIVVNDRFI
jgi:hypothetical protein